MCAQYVTMSVVHGEEAGRVAEAGRRRRRLRLGSRRATEVAARPNLGAIKLSVHLVVPDASAAMDWYAAAFGAQERSRIPLPGGTVMVVEMQLGDAVVHVASEFPDAGIVSPLIIGGTATVLQLNVEDVDAAWARAVEAGATVGHDLAETFWGERHGQLTDPFGHRWNLAQRIRDVPQDEIVAAAAQAFGG
jgi:PhnB protein